MTGALPPSQDKGTGTGGGKYGTVAALPATGGAPPRSSPPSCQLPRSSVKLSAVVSGVLSFAAGSSSGSGSRERAAPPCQTPLPWLPPLPQPSTKQPIPVLGPSDRPGFAHSEVCPVISRTGGLQLAPVVLQYSRPPLHVRDESYGGVIQLQTKGSSGVSMLVTLHEQRGGQAMHSARAALQAALQHAIAPFVSRQEGRLLEA
jgi:hypothetical protein